MSSPLLSTLLVVVACGGGRCVPAQTATIDLPDPALAERPQVVVLSGISTEGGGDGAFQSFFLSAECPVGAYQHVGLQYGTYLPDENNYYVSLREGGCEIGLFSKFFLHGRLSGRRSHLYYGPQLRFGSGPMALKKDVLVLDLSATGNEQLRIRLESGFLFWEIDWVALDFSDPVPVTVQTLLPAPGAACCYMPRGITKSCVIRLPASLTCSTSGIFRSRMRWPITRGFGGGK